MRKLVTIGAALVLLSSLRLDSAYGTAELEVRASAVETAIKLLRVSTLYQAHIKACIDKLRRQAHLFVIDEEDASILCPDHYLLLTSRSHLDEIFAEQTASNNAQVISHGRGSDRYDRFVLSVADGEMRTVHGAFIEGQCYIRIRQFEIYTITQWLQGMDMCQTERTNKGFILDLRGNPGGDKLVVQQILATLSSDPNDVITTELGSHGVSTIRVRDAILGFEKRLGAYEDRCIAVLISRRSASGSEMLAGTLKDWREHGLCVLLLGERTYGKGLIQARLDLASGYVFIWTVAEYLVGNQQVPVQGVGVSPDVTLDEMGMPFWKHNVPTDEDFESDPLLLGALLWLSQYGQDERIDVR